MATEMSPRKPEIRKPSIEGISEISISSLSGNDGNSGISRFSAQDAREQPGDVVIGRIKKSSRESIEIRLRWISGRRLVVIRLGREDAAGVWKPLNDTSRCGISIRADLLSETLDRLEAAEDSLYDEGALR